MADRVVAGQEAAVITKPILFNTPEADAILNTLEVLPPDNAWNQVVSAWPAHPNSKTIVASIGNGKPLRYNADMAFILVPPDQKRVEVKIADYATQSDPGPYPFPTKCRLKETNLIRRATDTPSSLIPSTGCFTNSTGCGEPVAVGRRHRPPSLI